MNETTVLLSFGEMQESNKASNSGIINGTCNENFTKFRKYRYWDPKVCS